MRQFVERDRTLAAATLAVLCGLPSLGCGTDAINSPAGHADASAASPDAGERENPNGPTRGNGGSGSAAPGGSGGEAGGSGGATGGAGGEAGGAGGETGGAGGETGGAGGEAGGATGLLPAGIPAPPFGYPPVPSARATYFVDNTNPNCDNGEGTQAAPFCDLFRGTQSVTYEAGAAVHVLGGPYRLSGDYEATLSGTEANPVVVRGEGDARILLDGDGTRSDFSWNGSYAVIENLGFYHQTKHVIDGDHLAFRNIAVTNPVDAAIDFNPVVNVRGHDIVIAESEIGNNRRANETDSHGIQAGEGSHHVWILNNEIYNNNGDAFQGCHECFDQPPHHIYIGGNVLHEDRENAVDLKTIHDVVVSENVMYGYGASGTSNGDAMVIGSNGFDDAINQGPRRVWVVGNEFRDSARAIRIEGSEDVWIVGNVMTAVTDALQIDDKPHRGVVFWGNTVSGVETGFRAYGCQPDAIDVVNNIFADVSGRFIDLTDCGEAIVQVTNNLFFNPGGAFSVRIDRTNHTTLASLEGLAQADSNIEDDPLFGSGGFALTGKSPAVDAGASPDALYEQFESTWGASIAVDRAGTARPAGAAADIGAYERP